MEKKLEILLEALRLALARSEEQRLYRSGKLDGLFASRTGAAGEAADDALRLGLLAVSRTETRGKLTIDWVRPTPAGVEFLHQHESPVRTLHELRETLRVNQRAIPLWLEDLHANLHTLETALTASAERWVAKLEELTRRVDDTLRRIEAASPLVPKELLDGLPWSIDAVNYLDRRRNAGAPDACPLPELFAALTGPHPTLTLTMFHVGLRKLHERRVVALHPATEGIDQPEFALLEGGRLLYFASR